jgi:GDP-4-dehydro-6-deoxy-D-mannose reductase
MKRLWVTGLDGFVGRVVQESVESGNTGNGFQLAIPAIAMDLLDPASLDKAIGEAQPDFVLHLAGQSFVPTAISDPRATYNVNFFGTLNLLEALDRGRFVGRMLYVGSGEVYGLVEATDLPVTETHVLRPRNPYAVSKAAAELLCSQWGQAHGFEVVLARPFNHVGPGQADWFVVSDFAKQVAEIKLGLREPVIYVGAVDVTRDFTDVRDVVRAYFMLLENGENGEAYNVCSEQEQSVRAVLERLIALAEVDCRIEQQSSRLRPSEQKRMCGSFSKLNRRAGWRPEIRMDRSLRDVLSYWESKLKHA